ncbi:hypothetical protein GIB67_019641 [Kingdonia uniflora]|uniref:SWIM-type domain-containing protein n=1 Tax=Kingdonia uniflora TaxID=39325 RepID=A0A7J7N0H5_9MAGN|nr:hypothetical protein GIB67_019641 [Kingdonia uniflora]
MENFYEQYHPEGADDGCHIAIGANGKRWRVNIKKHECDCHQWQVNSLPCVHVVSILMKFRVSWIEYCSPYHIVSSYVKTNKKAIYPIVDPSEWGKPIDDFLTPPLVRGSGRPRKVRIPYPDEALGPQKKCGKCGGFGHNKKSCKGDPVLSKQSKRSQDKDKGLIHTQVELSTGGTPINHLQHQMWEVEVGLYVAKGGVDQAAIGVGEVERWSRGGRGGATIGVTRCGAREGANRGPNVGGNVGPSATRGSATGGGATKTFNSHAQAQQSQASTSSPYKKSFQPPSRIWRP